MHCEPFEPLRYWKFITFRDKDVISIYLCDAELYNHKQIFFFNTNVVILIN
jgi:hypothetical protein